MKQIHTGIFIFIMVLLTSCSGKSGEEERILTVTLEPLRYFTEQIAGDKFKVVSMVPKGSSPETYDPTPQQLVKLGESRAYFRIGHIGFEKVWMDKLQNNNPHLQIFDTSLGVDLIREDGPHHGEEDHNHGGVEPHIWNSAANALIISHNIKNALCQIDAPNAPYYEARFDSLKQTILQTDSTLHSLLQNADRSFMIYHPALSYFARDYGLKQISIEEGGKEPSPAHLKQLIEQSHKDSVKVIFVQQEFDLRNAELIAKETSIRIVPINPLSYHWQTEMEQIAKALHHD